MTLELPYAGPNRTWGIQEGFVYPLKGSPSIPKGWKKSERGRYSEPGFLLHLFTVQPKRLDKYNYRTRSEDKEKLILSEEDAQGFLSYSYNSSSWYSVGPQMGVISTNKVIREGGFLGFGATKRVEVYQEEKIVGWNFEVRSSILHEDLFSGFTREDVLTAADKILQAAKELDHDAALYMDSERHVGFYPPKTLGEQFPEA